MGCFGCGDCRGAGKTAPRNDKSIGERGYGGRGDFGGVGIATAPEGRRLAMTNNAGGLKWPSCGVNLQFRDKFGSRIAPNRGAASHCRLGQQ
jgi:hypothetical protein